MKIRAESVRLKQVNEKNKESKIKTDICPSDSAFSVVFVHYPHYRLAALTSITKPSVSRHVAEIQL